MSPSVLDGVRERKCMTASLSFLGCCKEAKRPAHNTTTSSAFCLFRPSAPCCQYVNIVSLTQEVKQEFVVHDLLLMLSKNGVYPMHHLPPLPPQRNL